MPCLMTTTSQNVFNTSLYSNSSPLKFWPKVITSPRHVHVFCSFSQNPHSFSCKKCCSRSLNPPGTPRFMCHVSQRLDCPLKDMVIKVTNQLSGCRHSMWCILTTHWSWILGVSVFSKLIFFFLSLATGRQQSTTDWIQYTVMLVKHDIKHCFAYFFDLF